MVFRHEYVFLVRLRELDTHSVTYRPEKKKACDSFIHVPKRAAQKHVLHCHCGLLSV